MTPLNRSADRRGALLLLVLGMLTLFVIIGGLMLTLATRTRIAARAFADATRTTSAGPLQSRGALDEALMVLLRGARNEAALPLPMRGQSILEDRYGATTMGEAVAGSVKQLTMGTLNNYKAILQASVQNLSPAVTHPCDLNGRIITFKPDPDDGTVASYRILRTTGTAQPYTVFLANTPTNKFAVLPKNRCDVVINGPEFLDESYDSFGVDPWLARMELKDSRVAKVSQCTYGATAACDNDNDGVPDGVWLSGVIPDRPAPSGGTLKYDVSYLVLDLDGRINFNAHGSLAATLAAASWPGTVGGLAVGSVPVGLGYGPADVDASRLLAGGPNATAVPGFPSTRWSNVVLGSTAAPTQTTATADQRRPAPVLGASATTPVEGRYGTDKKPGSGAAFPTLQQLAVQGDSPTDLQTQTRAYLQPPAGNAGVPTLTFFTPSNAINDLQSSPYDLRLDSDGPRSAAIRNAVGDNPFTVAELERILRQFDADATSLPQRFATLLDGYAERSRMTITTDSWDTPALTGSVLKKVRDFMRQFPAPTAPTSIVPGASEVYGTISPDVTAGLRFDINRPLEHPAVPAGLLPSVKERYCQHLYTLLVALGQPAGVGTAQWVANVCDFRDLDSAMTRFRIDGTITDGWSPQADGQFVFGAERPDVVITETVGWSGSLFVTLHHPWSAVRVDAGNASVATEVVDAALGTNNSVELTKKSGTASVWRLRVEGGAAVGLGDAAAAGQSVSLGPNAYAVVQTADSSGTVIPNKITLPALVAPPAGTVVLERLADPAKALNNDQTSNDFNPYVVVDRAPFTVAQDQNSAQKQRRSSVSFWKQAWSASGPGDTVPAVYPSLAPWFHWPNRPFVSVAELALVPPGDASGMLASFTLPTAGTPLPTPVADPASGIFDAVHVPSRFATTVLPFGGANDVLTPLIATEKVASNGIPRWREPGRVNVNTIAPNTGNSVSVLDDAVWKATVGDGGPPANPFANNPADSITKLLALGAAGGAPYFDAPVASRDGDAFFNYTTANRVANAGTIRSHVFAVWITLKTTDTSAGAPAETYNRMFAIVDRSIPVGFNKGANLNVRDTIRLQRFLE
jgi:hypothetical protein